MVITLHFATGNAHKFEEARAYLEGSVHGLTLKHLKANLPELQADTLAEVARYKVDAAARMCADDVFVEDAGLFVPVLNGFPGVFSAEVMRMLGCKGILKLMADVTEPARRAAYFEVCTCLFIKRTGEVKEFMGHVDGTISIEERGKGGFGYDPIFISDDPAGNTRTFAEMGFEEKNRVSHRTQSLRKLKDFLAAGAASY
ncbi:MAG: RdgB/HAM1 family non-canonical purine NTP pyrophosphatase [Candidatus Lokiarchaeota archaeon]|nr:RdgB/HAM1 family non-canonical purine NTP pyrophosphatase [Candidatus Lokiarchaeota archaeon]